MKGVSPLVATVLLIVIVVSLGGVIFSWMSGFTTQSTNRMQNRTAEVVDCTGAATKIEAVYLRNGTNASVRAVVQNTGTAKNIIQDARATTADGRMFDASNIPVSIKPGEVTTLVFDGLGTQNCSSFSKVSIDTACTDVGDEFDGPAIC